MTQRENYKTNILGKEYQFKIEEAHSGTSLKEIRKAVKNLKAAMYERERFASQVSETSIIVFTDVNYVIKACFYGLDENGDLYDNYPIFETVVLDARPKKK